MHQSQLHPRLPYHIDCTRALHVPVEAYFGTRGLNPILILGDYRWRQQIRALHGCRHKKGLKDRSAHPPSAALPLHEKVLTLSSAFTLPRCLLGTWSISTLHKTRILSTALLYYTLRASIYYHHKST